jgi:TRAP-type C4-dicarboxylate transport system substrate-binding protein
MTLSLASCGSSTSSTSGGYDGPSYNLQFGHIAAEGALEDTVAKRFKELVEEASDGKIQITLYGNSQMGGLTELVDALRYDTLDLAIFTQGNAQSYFPKAALWALPYQISSYEHAEAAL